MNILLDAVWKAQKETVEMDHWAQRYPTNTEDVARVCLDLAQKHIDEPFSLPQILQFSSEDRLTKYEMCQIIAEILGLSLASMNAITDGGNPKAGVQRPYDTHLSTQALVDMAIDIRTQDFRAWW